MIFSVTKMWSHISLTLKLILILRTISHLPKPSNSLLIIPNPCNESCGETAIPFPFHLNSSCSSAAATSALFHLSCATNATSSTTPHLTLTLEKLKLRVIEFYADATVLVDLSSSSRRLYGDLNSFELGDKEKQYLGVSEDNVIGLYDCDDSSVCKAECEGSSSSSECCYPLSDHSAWRVGFDVGFQGFGRFGCRGFSARPGLKLEWAVPRNNNNNNNVSLMCDVNASVVNSTAVRGGLRCLCGDGFVGDGFLLGNGCVKSCIKDRREVYGSECDQQKHYTNNNNDNNDRKLVIIGGVLSSVFIVASFVALFCLLKKQPELVGKSGSEYHYHHNHPSFSGDITSHRKPYKSRIFTHQELAEATQGFDKTLTNNNYLPLFLKGVLSDGTLVSVQTIQCRNETDLIQVLSRADALSSTVFHRNLARVLGVCLDSSHSPLVVYERPPNGTLEDRLPSLDWPRRLNIAIEVSAVLTFLHREVDPPMPHRDLGPGSVFLDEGFSVKLAGFGLPAEDNNNNNNNNNNSSDDDVREMGMLLARLVGGSETTSGTELTPHKFGLWVRTRGKLEEAAVDPGLYFHEQPCCRREQIESVADLAARCLMFNTHRGKRLGMVDVWRELERINGSVVVDNGGNTSGSKRGQGLEETFSNSSLLQMISMSPDSIYLP